MHSRTILLVEDEPVTRIMIEARLHAAGYTVRTAPNGEAALALLNLEQFTVLLTDLFLEALDGIDLMARAKAIDPELEVIVITGGATVESAIAAVNYGAYAYLRKPLAPGELEERVGAAMRRREDQIARTTALKQVSATLLQIAEPPRPGYTTAPVQAQMARVGAIEIDPERRRVVVAGSPVVLSATQFDLLLFLARRADVVHSPETLAREVLGYSCPLPEARELIKASIHRLRLKIEPDPRAPAYLLSVRGAGYMLSSGK